MAHLTMVAPIRVGDCRKAGASPSAAKSELSEFTYRWVQVRLFIDGFRSFAGLFLLARVFF
jgi:hypothetical protein